MSITDELREIAVKTECASGRCEKLYRGDLEHAADRIDEGIEREYVKLPVDADGVPIRVGDELTNGIDLPAKVRGMSLDEDGWLVSSASFGVGRRVDPSTLHHTRPDSWERIIEDAQEYVTDDEPLYSVSELVERCRRLAGEA